MSVKVKRAGGRRKRLRSRPQGDNNPSSRFHWLTMLSDEGDADENEDAGEEDQELSSGASQLLRTRRK
jgi:hypothetical protein